MCRENRHVSKDAQCARLADCASLGSFVLTTNLTPELLFSRGETVVMPAKSHRAIFQFCQNKAGRPLCIALDFWFGKQPLPAGETGVGYCMRK
jgi:hypothetical protein